MQAVTFRSQTEATVAKHYSVENPNQRVYEGLKSAGIDLAKLAVDQLAPVDEFHIRGREATEELTTLFNLSATDRVLDVGCGIGGSARYLAARHGCHVTGIDLTQEYCDLATELSSKLGLSDRTTFRQASAVELPFEEASFDVVWTEHAQMNIADKRGFYGEIARVLRPDGLFVFHDIFAGPKGMLEFPVPWSSVPESSFLAGAGAIRDILGDLGLEEVVWRDCTEQSTQWFRGIRERFQTSGPPAVGVHLLMGARASDKVVNAYNGLNDGALVTIQGVLRKSR